MAQVSLPMAERHFGQTSRRDAWWVQPLFVFLALSAFIVYATARAFEGGHYAYGPYLSPMYSPLLFGEPDHAWFGPQPAWLLLSPAFLILWAPGGFRLTCYYYRGAYYKAFWMDPPNCTVGEPRKTYWGERYFPLLIQNVHRYFMYLALLFLIFLALDVWHALWFKDAATGKVSFGIGVGTLVLALNVFLLGGYTFSCHSLRHLVSGGIRQISRHPLRHKAYNCVSCLNRWHMTWAWCSLLWVAFADLYVRQCATGAWTDWRII